VSFAEFAESPKELSLAKEAHEKTALVGGLLAGAALSRALGSQAVRRGVGAFLASQKAGKTFFPSVGAGLRAGAGHLGGTLQRYAAGASIARRAAESSTPTKVSTPTYSTPQSVTELIGASPTTVAGLKRKQ